MMSSKQPAASELPAPLVPEYVDLGDFPYMPVYITRLLRSRAWLMCKRQPELGFYLMNLWMRCFQEHPAGSIEDDDDVLADAAMCSPERWHEVRKAALRGWVKCSDGRLYHPFQSDVVVPESWKARIWKRYRQECDRVRKANAKAKKDGLAEVEVPSFDTWKLTAFHDVPSEFHWNAIGIPRNGEALPGHSSEIQTREAKLREGKLREGKLREAKGREAITSPTVLRTSGGKPPPARADAKNPAAGAASPAVAGATHAPPRTKAKGKADPVRDEIWRLGKDVLMAGEGGLLSQERAGSVLGRFVKDYGQKLVLDALRDCAKAAPIKPIEWLTARCQERRRDAPEGTLAAMNGGLGANKQQILEMRNAAVGDAWLAKQRAKRSNGSDGIPQEVHGTSEAVDDDGEVRDAMG
jgi:hypothetical protein